MVITYHIDDIEQVARQIIAHAPHDTFVFKAPMGAGKTTLITAMCKQLGVQDDISSPTFSIVNEYIGATDKIFHFDLYRIEEEEELIHMGIEDYIHKKAILFIEWPEIVIPYLEQFTKVEIAIIDDRKRQVSIS